MLMLNLSQVIRPRPQVEPHRRRGLPRAVRGRRLVPRPRFTAEKRGGQIRGCVGRLSLLWRFASLHTGLHNTISNNNNDYNNYNYHQVYIVYDAYLSLQLDNLDSVLNSFNVFLNCKNAQFLANFTTDTIGKTPFFMVSLVP